MADKKVLFVLEGEPVEPRIIFSAKIDDDGDLHISANGKELLYISNRDGKLHRYYVVEKVAGLEFTADDQIAVAV